EVIPREVAELPRPPRRVVVPVPLPAGVQWEGIFGPLGEWDDDALVDSASLTSRDSVRQLARRTEVNGRSVNSVVAKSSASPRTRPGLGIGRGTIERRVDADGMSGMGAFFGGGGRPASGAGPAPGPIGLGGGSGMMMTGGAMMGSSADSSSS